jgi:hypothetical protein
LLRTPRIPITPADVADITTGTINVGNKQRRLLIARKGTLPPELYVFANKQAAIDVINQLSDSDATARQIDLQAGRLNPSGKVTLLGTSLRQQLARQIAGDVLDAAVVTQSGAAHTIASRPDAETPVDRMGALEKIGGALKRSFPYAVQAGGDAIRLAVEDFLKPESIAVMIALAAGVALANTNPISGAAVDTTLVVLAWVNGGMKAIEGISAFVLATIDAQSATTEAELDNAAKAYGKALGAMGPDLLNAIVGKFVPKKGGSRSTDKGPSGSASKLVGEKPHVNTGKGGVAKNAALTASARKAALLEKGVPTKTLETLKNDKQLAAFEKALDDIDKLDLSKMKGSGCIFYSGSMHGKPAWQSAQRRAQEKNMNWITEASGGVLDKNRASIPPKAMNFLDVKLSRKMAENASGDISVIGDPRTMNVETGIFYKEELPRLLENEKISATSKAELQQLKQILDAKAKALEAAKAAGKSVPFNSIF